MKLKELIGCIVIEASKHGVDALDLDVDCIDIGSTSSVSFESVDVFIDKVHKQVTVHEGDSSCD